MLSSARRATLTPSAETAARQRRGAALCHDQRARPHGGGGLTTHPTPAPPGATFATAAASPPKRPAQHEVARPAQAMGVPPAPSEVGLPEARHPQHQPYGHVDAVSASVLGRAPSLL